VRFVELDHRNAIEAERIRRLTRASYRVEGELLGVRDFPPALRTAAEIRAADSRFVALLESGTLYAVAELEGAGGETPNIAGFTVHPSLFRRGLGTELLGRVLALLGSRRVTVSTGEENLPALRLYEKHGFRVVERWSAPGKIPMVTLAREAEPAG
jgi:ribosomal protein S18 acetylase RimI-like enzyme